MSSSQHPQARTRMFARVLGPYFVIAVATAAPRTSDMQSLISEFDASTAWPWVTGAIALLIGLVIIALHQYWRGVAAIIVSALGWLAALEGLVLLAFPQSYISVGSSMVDAVIWWWAACVVMGLVGLYLTYVGWTPTPSRKTAQSQSSNPDRPHAA